MPRNTAVFNKTFSGAGILRSDDITRDPRYGHNAPHHGMPRSFASGKLSGSAREFARGETIGGLFLGHSRPGIFKEEHERLIVLLRRRLELLSRMPSCMRRLNN